MRLIRLQLQNFGSFQGEHGPFPLKNLGLVAVRGKNGAGKSTVPGDALVWGLFGETAARRVTKTNDSGLKADDVINETVGRDCVVVVDFVGIDGQDYTAQRWRKAKIGKSRKRTNGVRLLRGTEVVSEVDPNKIQADINRVLGMDRELFCQVVVRGQEDAYNFCQSTPDERSEILTRIEGVEELSEWEDRMRVHGRELAKGQVDLEGEIAGWTRAAAMYGTEELEAQAHYWERQREEQVTKLQESLESSQAAVAQRQEQVAKKPEYERGLQAIDEQMAALVDSPEPEVLLQWRQYRETSTQALGAAQADERQAQGVLARQAQLGAACEACGQAITEEHKAQRQVELQAQLTTAQAAGQEAQAAVQQADEAIAQAQGVHDQARQEAGDQRTELATRRGQLVQVLERIATVEQEDKTGGTADRFEAQLSEYLNQPNPFASQIEDMQKRMGETQELILEADGKLKQIRIDIELVEWWLRSIPSMKAWIFDTVVQELTAAANRWLGIFTGGLCWVQIESVSTTKAGATRDRIAVRCFLWNPDRTITERDFRKWSVGQKRRISLSVDLALASRLAQRAKVRSNLLILDEVDRDLDAEGRQQLLLVLQELQAEHESVIVISHAPEFRTSGAHHLWDVTLTPQGTQINVTGALQDGLDHAA